VFEDHPRAGELAEAMQRDMETLISVFELSSAPDADEEKVLKVGQSLRALETRWLELGLAIAATPDSDSAGAALSHFLDRAAKQ
jgi:hypothetical protein